MPRIVCFQYLIDVAAVLVLCMPQFATSISSLHLLPACSVHSIQHDRSCRRTGQYVPGHEGLVQFMQGPQTALLGPLKEVLESMTGGYEVMKEVVAALQDTERGKTASMTVLLQELQERQAGKPSREEQERLRQEVSLHLTFHHMLIICWT